MNNTLRALFGAWVQALGTTLSAIGSTPSLKIKQKILADLNLWGNVMQATGNALLAESEQKLDLDKIGNEVQAFGNSTVIASILLDIQREYKLELDIKGNLLQALGSGMSFTDVLEHEPSIPDLYSLYGNLLQAIGNSLQALAGINKLQVGEGEHINTIGSWIQAIGAILTAKAQSMGSDVL
ncbi:hypothetical protein JOD43_000448 [Pullulanibacillus pueri]|uniref:Uncharacterized protein n=1 Tax=Pullulanibacillus pueri TaxID=1437324 RepID=A0A8J2ZSH5_9BACL|nr:hypothetical protein [Pullulanibacillus pueri]MBM7680289.1 hypothetical protein [Pullulanibacillus pueri]GGH75821.1 hypothetical protein GCM10007096_05440 [Pullulanibacillus pueri]